MSPRPKIGLDLETILSKAGEIADESGIYEVTLANLAKRLLIRPPSLYNHIDGLADLRKKLAIFAIDQLYSELLYSAVGLSKDEAIMSLSRTYVHFARKHPGLYEASLFAPDMGDTDVQQAGAKIVDLAMRILDGYDLKGENALHAVRGFRSILHGFSSLEQKGGFKLSLDFDESLEVIIKTFLNGIKEIR